jgi:hypothetical protein
MFKFQRKKEKQMHGAKNSKNQSFKKERLPVTDSDLQEIATARPQNLYLRFSRTRENLERGKTIDMYT